MPVISLTHNGDIRHAADAGKSHSLMYSVALFPFSICCFLSESVVPFLSLLFPSQSVTSFSLVCCYFSQFVGPFSQFVALFFS
jgi:hypothetical protein